MRLSVRGVDTYAYTGTRGLDAARPSVVFVHGAGNDHSVWALQSRYFAHHGCNAVAVDLPGHGRSAGAALDSVEALAEWVDALVASIGATNVSLVGHSMGALAVLELAGRSPVPSYLDRIALLGPAVPMAVSEALLDAARRDDHQAFEMIVGWAHAPAALLGGHPVPGLWMAGGAMRLLERSRPGVLAADLAACSAYANGLAAARAVDRPALIVTGRRDLMAPPKSAQALIETLRDVRVVSLPNCGHSMTTEAPAEILDALIAFL